MTVCGYNARMGRGILELFDGMYDVIADKAATEGTDVTGILKRELIEVPGVNAGLARGSGTSPRMLEGLNAMALPLFRELAGDARFDGSRQAFMARANLFIEMLWAVEGFSEALPRPDDGACEKVAARAERIGNWAAETFSSRPA